MAGNENLKHWCFVCCGRQKDVMHWGQFLAGDFWYGRQLMEGYPSARRGGACLHAAWTCEFPSKWRGSWEVHACMRRPTEFLS